jgi:hypothetical protein
LSDSLELLEGHNHRRTLVYIKVDLQAAPPSVSLEEAANCKQFHVLAVGDGDDAAVATALSSAGVGRPSSNPGHVYVPIDTVRTMAGATGVASSWEDDFSGMVGYASSKGWLDDSGTAIEAHIERQAAGTAP